MSYHNIYIYHYEQHGKDKFINWLYASKFYLEWLAHSKQEFLQLHETLCWSTCFLWSWDFCEVEQHSFHWDEVHSPSVHPFYILCNEPRLGSTHCSLSLAKQGTGRRLLCVKLCRWWSDSPRGMIPEGNGPV